MENNDEFFEPIKCITFDKEAQANIPKEIRERMNRDRQTAESNAYVMEAVKSMKNDFPQEAYQKAVYAKENAVWMYVDDELRDEFNDLFGDLQRTIG